MFRIVFIWRKVIGEVGEWGKCHFSKVGESDITSNTSGVHLSESENINGEFRCYVKFINSKKT